MIPLHTTNVFEHYKNGIRTLHANDHQRSLNELMQLRIPFVFMNTDFAFLLGNDTAAELVGAISAKDLVNRSAKNFCTRDFSRQLHINDKFVIESKKTLVIQETGSRLDHETASAIAIKMPWYVNDKIAGILYTGIDLTPAKIQKFPFNIQSLLNTGLLDNHFRESDPNIKNLTKREYQIFLMILKGLTATQIAESLYISKRTTEHHIESIRGKLGCKSKYEVIIKYKDLINL